MSNEVPDVDKSERMIRKLLISRGALADSIAHHILLGYYTMSQKRFALRVVNRHKTGRASSVTDVVRWMAKMLRMQPSWCSALAGKKKLSPYPKTLMTQREIAEVVESGMKTVIESYKSRVRGTMLLVSVRDVDA